MRQYWAGSWKNSTIFYVKGFARLLRSILVLLFSGREDPTGAVLGCVIDMLVIVHVMVVDTLVVAQMQIPMVRTTEILCMCLMSLLCMSSRFPVQSARRQS